jgi:hypothetical protein
MISRLALYFGSTWQVNCIVLSAILAILLVANLFVQRFPAFRLGWLYTILIIALIAIYIVPWESIPSEHAPQGRC